MLSKPRRIISAKDKPIVLALSRCSGGSFLTKIAMKTIDLRVSEVLKVKFQLGLFDQPYVENPKASDDLVHTKADEEFSKQMLQSLHKLIMHFTSHLAASTRWRVYLLIFCLPVFLHWLSFRCPATVGSL